MSYEARPDHFPQHDPDEVTEHTPRHRRGTRLAVVAGIGVAVLLAVGLTGFAGSVLFGGHSSGGTQRTAVAGDATGDATGNAGATGGNGTPGQSGQPGTAGTPGAGVTEHATASPAPGRPGATTPAGQRTTPPANPRTTAPASGNDAYESEVLTLVNVERGKAGCKPLAYNAKLTTAARKHSQDMAARNFFDHTNPDGVDFATRITRAGYHWSGAAENIAKGQRTPQEVMTAWMNSSGHRANILNCGLKDLGVGLAYQGKSAIWTQDFGSPA